MCPYGTACLKRHMPLVRAGCCTHLNNIGIPTMDSMSLLKALFIHPELKEVTELMDYMIGPDSNENHLVDGGFLAAICDIFLSNGFWDWFVSGCANRLM